MADKHHIITISAIVFCFLADRLLVSCSVDYAERRAGPSIINLRDSNSAPSHIGRFKRAINAKLASSNFTLPDKEHNEAIVHWSGKKSEAVFILTRKRTRTDVTDSKLWRSTDNGATFHLVQLSKTIKDITIYFYYVCPNNKDKLVFVDVKNLFVFVTDDEGKSYTPHKLGFQPTRLTFHPKKEDWILGYSLPDRTLHMSSDLGRSWDLVDEYVNPRVFWGVPGVDKDESTIHYEYQDPSSGTYHHKSQSKPYSKNSPFNATTGSISAASLVVQDDYIFIEKIDQYTSYLYVSYKRGDFKIALFPLNVEPQNYRILDTNEGLVFLAVNHKEENVKLYLSDATGQFYATTLDDVISYNMPYSGRFDVSFYEVQGIKGTYIANKRQTDGHLRTYITYDMGRTWGLIRAPDKDSQGQPTNCQFPKCSLNLYVGIHAAVHNIPGITSEKNSPGIIMAHGWIGSELSPYRNNSYLSRDGGVTWKEIFIGNYHFNIIDQGGAMVAIPYGTPSTQYLKYSCTEGEKWEDLQFTTEPIHVDGVLDEPGITTLIVSVFGHKTKSEGWTIVKLDFHSVLEKQCAAADYELWTLGDKLPSKPCILGEQVVYERRKQLSQCYNGQDYERPKNITQCVCTPRDYQCDYGYYQKSRDECSLADWYNPANPPFLCPEGTTYNKTEGFRKIASDNCTGGVQHPHPSTKCPVMQPAKLSIKISKNLVAATNKPVNLTLLQAKGSTKSTIYIWHFGDGVNYTVAGLEKASKVVHTYKTRGSYIITVMAKNAKGVNQTSMKLRVEDEIQSLIVERQNGVRVNYPVTFYVTPVSKVKFSEDGMKHVHYLWTFGDEAEGSKPQLTWENSIQHSFSKAKKYTVTVEAFNPLGSSYREFTISVYSDVVTIQLLFSSGLDRVSKDNALWRKLFAAMLREKLADVLAVPSSRLEVHVLPSTPIKADVSILPKLPEAAKGAPIDTVSKALLQKANSKEGIAIQLDYDYIVQVVHARKLTDGPGGREDTKTNYLAVFICVPVLLVAIFVTFLVFLYYRKKFMEVRRYSVLRDNHGGDSLLDDDDDDDPPLDPNPDLGPRDDALLNDDEDGLQEFGSGPTLVMMTNNPATTQDGSINC